MRPSDVVVEVVVAPLLKTLTGVVKLFNDQYSLYPVIGVPPLSLVADHYKVIWVSSWLTSIGIEGGEAGYADISIAISLRSLTPIAFVALTAKP